jgi:ABC-type branched-subunit amino acid transport system substrate-binding protein
MSRRVLSHALVAALAAIAFLSVLALPASVAAGRTAKPAAGKTKATKAPVGQSTILIGSVSGTSGAYASTGEATVDGALLAVAHVDKTGGVLGKQLTLQSYDDAASPTLAATLFKRLVKAGAVAVLGSDDSGAATAATADQLHIPELGVVDDATSAAQPWVWSSGPGSATVASVDAAYALKSCKSLALLHDTSSYGAAGAAAVKAAYTKAHGTLALSDAISENLLTGATAVSTKEIKRIKTSKAKCVMAWLTPADTASLAQTLKADRVHVKLIASDAVVADRTFSALAGTAANGTVAPELTAQLHPTPALARFIKAYKAKFHLAPTADAITSYDTVLVLAAAIKRAGSTSAVKLQKALNGLTGTLELQGNIAFTKRDHAALSAQQLTLVVYDAAAKAWKAL